MTPAPKNQPTFNINTVGNLNTGDVTIQGNQIGSQNNYAADPEVTGTISDLKTLIPQLQLQYPHVSSEAEALEIIDAEFTAIQHNGTHKLTVLRQQLLNPERHLQATKATLIEVVKSAYENSLIAKAIITYFDKLSEIPDQGA